MEEKDENVIEEITQEITEQVEETPQVMKVNLNLLVTIALLK